MSAHLGVDFDLGLPSDVPGAVFADPTTSLDLRPGRRPGVRPPAVDILTVSGRHNLAQALVLRLLTERGELAPLGHPSYGSRHHELIGQPNTERNRNLLKLHVLECLGQEPRVSVESLDVQPVPGREGRDSVRVVARLRIVDDPTPLNLVVPFAFGGSAP